MAVREFGPVAAAAFVVLACSIVVFRIVGDLFRDRATGGWGKAAWLVALVLVPLPAALAYVVRRGPAMAERAETAALREWEARTEYIRVVAGADPVTQIGDAHRLLDSGTINAAEFASIKAAILGR